jgi:hypothetical protein
MRTTLFAAEAGELARSSPACPRIPARLIVPLGHQDETAAGRLNRPHPRRADVRRAGVHDVKPAVDRPVAERHYTKISRRSRP